MARLEEPDDFATLIAALGDEDALVRREAANSLAQAFFHSKPGAEATLARQAIEARALTEPTDAARTMLRALGELPHEAESGRQVERLLLKQADSVQLFRQLGALEGLEALFRRGHVSDAELATRRRLRELATPGQGRIPLLPALMALQASRDDDARTIIAGARYRCAPPANAVCGWQFRRIAVQMMDPTSDTFSDPLRDALHDVAFQVRVDALAVVARGIGTTHNCAALVEAFDDPVQVVATRAIDLVDVRCSELDEINGILKRLVADLGDPFKIEEWVQPAHAFESLARLLPSAAKTVLHQAAAGHPKWPVRSAAARVAGLLEDPEIAVQLSRDQEPKVRADAMSALARMKSPALRDAAIEELARLEIRSPSPERKPPDAQSLWTAVVALKGQADVGLTRHLVRVLRQPIIARMARLATLERLQEIGKRDQYGLSPLREAVRDLEPFLKDDPPVANAVAETIAIITGVRPAIPERPPVVSRVAAGRVVRVIVTLTGGDRLVLDLNADEAPAIVNKFVARVRDQKDAYAATFFHRLLPNAIIQGGSRDGTDWGAAPACDAPATVLGRPSCEFWRDEFNPLLHERGAVALATNGRDTGIGQFFIDLVDLPAFNHEYTVFGRVACAKPARPTSYVVSDPMDIVDGLSEGQQIQKIEIPVRPPDWNAYICSANNR